MLDPRHYELLAKYDSAEEFDFDADELATICTILNLNIKTFAEPRLQEYRMIISQAGHDQNKVMTEIGGEYLSRANERSELEALSYVVDNISRIRSPYMLDILVGLISHKAK
jgi:hypothetical protein